MEEVGDSKIMGEVLAVIEFFGFRKCYEYYWRVMLKAITQFIMTVS